MRINWDNILNYDLDAGLIGLMYDFRPCDINLLETLAWAHRIRKHSGFQEIDGLTKTPRRVIGDLQRAKAHQITTSALLELGLDDATEEHVREVYDSIGRALNELVRTGLSAMFNAAKDCPTSPHFYPIFELADKLISLIKDPEMAEDARSRFATLRRDSSIK